MPSYVFTGPDSRVYPESRDASGRPLGTVEPGDRRFFDDEAPDHMWAEVTSGEQEPDEHGEDSNEDGDPPEDPAPVPQPVPPAVISE